MVPHWGVSILNLMDLRHTQTRPAWFCTNLELTIQDGHFWTPPVFLAFPPHPWVPSPFSAAPPTFSPPSVNAGRLELPGCSHSAILGQQGFTWPTPPAIQPPPRCFLGFTFLHLSFVLPLAPPVKVTNNLCCQTNRNSNTTFCAHHPLLPVEVSWGSKSWMLKKNSR